MKVLIISTVGLIYDGITSVISEYIKAMDLEGLELFVVDTIRTEDSIRKELENIGCTIVSLPSRRESPFQYFCELTRLIKREKIDIVHAHGNSATLTIEMMAAYLGDCKCRIAHSHNTRCDQIRADKMLRPLFGLLCTDPIACGVDAGKWLFRDRPFFVLKNGRDLRRFAFRSDVREQIRKQYAIRNGIAIGHVGGFVEQKNHVFLLEIYAALLQMREEVFLFMVGDGELRQEIEQKAEHMGIRDRIVFTGILDHTDAFLQGMDVMVLPSLFEGLPLVAIEWQSSGLPCVLSDVITQECALTDLAEYVSLTATPEYWAERILNAVRTDDREMRSQKACEVLQTAGFDIRQNAAELRQYYLDHGKRR